MLGTLLVPNKVLGCAERGGESIPPSLLPSPVPPEAGGQRGGGRPSGAVPGAPVSAGCGAGRAAAPPSVPRHRPPFPVRRRRSCPLLAGGLDTSPNTCRAHSRQAPGKGAKAGTLIAANRPQIFTLRHEKKTRSAQPTCPGPRGRAAAPGGPRPAPGAPAAPGEPSSAAPSPPAPPGLPQPRPSPPQAPRRCAPAQPASAAHRSAAPGAEPAPPARPPPHPRVRHPAPRRLRGRTATAPAPGPRPPARHGTARHGTARTYSAGPPGRRRGPGGSPGAAPGDGRYDQRGAGWALRDPGFLRCCGVVREGCRFEHPRTWLAAPSLSWPQGGRREGTCSIPGPQGVI